jgi:REP element-mobilizing transposase RayT
MRWGGSRDGAGRKPAPRARVLHRKRADFPEPLPGLVTVRVRKDVPSLRIVRLIHTFERAFRRSADRGEFRVVHYSVQHDHIHLLVEAAGAAALARGMKSVTARLARAVNRVHCRRGPVVDGRFHHRVLATPREVRSALAYVLLNSRKHAAARGADPGTWASGLDPASSGRWFDGWTSPTPYAPPPRRSPGTDLASASRVATARPDPARRGSGRTKRPDAGGAPGVEWRATGRTLAWSDGAPAGFAESGGELWRIWYTVTNPITDTPAPRLGPRSPHNLPKKVSPTA